jgi:long-chain fatty acid transport protein
VVSGDVINTDIKFDGSNTWSGPPLADYTQTDNNVQGGNANFVPALNYAAPLSDRFFFGFSAAPTFGLQTDYPQSSILRYTATDSEIETIDLSPDLAFKINDKWSVGAGVDAERISATFNSVAGLPSYSTTPTAFDSSSQNTGDAWGYGWHAGGLYQLSPSTRFGLNYRSEITFDLTGTSKLIGPMGNPPTLTTPATLQSNNLKSDITLPPTTTLSAYHDITDAWAVDGSIYYTQWNIFNKNLTLQNVQAVNFEDIGGNLIPEAGLTNVTLPQDFRNTFRFAAGTSYAFTPQFLMRVGGGFEQTPTNNTDRNIRLPDGNRYALAIGAHYQAFKTLGFDGGWTHLFMQNVNVSAPVTAAGQTSTADGSFSNHADLIGAQLTWDIT